MDIRYKLIVEEPSFSAKIDKLRQYNPRINEVWETISWQLGRNPLLGRELLFKNHFVFETKPLDPTEPNYWILYKYENEEGRVILLSISPIPDENE